MTVFWTAFNAAWSLWGGFACYPDGNRVVSDGCQPQLSRFLDIKDRGALAIFLKHLMFAVVIALSAYIAWVMTPKLRHLALYRAREMGMAPEHCLQKQMVLLLRLNLILGLMILVLTALARTS